MGNKLIAAAIGVAMVWGQMGAAADLGAPLTVAQFQDFAMGKTLAYSRGGKVWGNEAHLPGNKVNWAYAGKTACIEGQMSDAKMADNSAEICFTYKGNAGKDCWQIYKSGNGLVAYPKTGDDATPSQVSVASKPLACSAK